MTGYSRSLNTCLDPNRRLGSLRISAMSVSHREVRLAAQRAQKKALEALRQQLS
jgi:hypothetical protein